MSRHDRWLVECRRPDGSLDFSGQQPDEVFGAGAIQGMADDEMAKAIYRCKPDATLSGDSIATWPALLDPRWRARRKTW